MQHQAVRPFESSGFFLRFFDIIINKSNDNFKAFISRPEAIDNNASYLKRFK